MKFTALLVLVLVGLCFGAHEEHQEHVERGHEERHHERQKTTSSEEEREKQQESGKKSESFKLDERTKQILIKDKSQTNVVLQKTRDFFLNNPNRESERQCFEKFESDESVDFVIDLAPSPSQDTIDRSVAESPISLYLDVMGGQRSASRSYFKAIELFIDSVTYDMKPSSTHSVIYNQGRKFYIRGKEIESPVKESLASEGGDFSDSTRNLMTMWPSPTKEMPESFLHPYLKNNLGRLTKQALWNRNNGVPTVLGDKRHSKPVYTILITDGSSGAKVQDLCDDLSRTTVIDIGNRRFLKNLDWGDMKKLVSVVAFSAPQQLASMVETCRTMACRLCGC